MPQLGTKVCVNCNREKPISEFRLKATHLRRVNAEHTSMCNVCATLRSLKGRKVKHSNAITAPRPTSTPVPHRTITET